MKRKGDYERWLREEEEKLRWLIQRLPWSLELHYYLVFLLVANREYAKALNECERVFATAPDDIMARVWRRMLRQMRRRGARCRPHLLAGGRERRAWAQACARQS